MANNGKKSEVNIDNKLIEQTGQHVAGHQANIVGDADIGWIGDKYEIAQAQFVLPTMFAEKLMNLLDPEETPDYTTLEGKEDWEPETVLVEAGTFLMGSQPGDDIPEHETPQFEMSLPTFRLGKYPVTNEQYYHFIRETKRTAPQELGWGGGGAPAKELLDLPVRGVNWYGALIYCYWLMEETGRPYTLPSEAQWEKAARGEGGLVYPWGNEWQPEKCNADCTRVTAVDAYQDGASPYGCLDMVGNVREWTTTLWGRNRRHLVQLEAPYPWSDPWRANKAYDDINASRQIRRVTRGGAALDDRIPLRAARRQSERPFKRGLNVNRIGFRVAMNWESE